MNLKIATWNMNYWQNSNKTQKQAWQYVLNQLKPDIFMFQEGNPKGININNDRFIYSTIDKFSRKTWGNGIYCPNYDIQPIFIEKSFDGQGGLMLGKIYIPKIKKFLITICLYGVLEKIGTTDYAIPNLHKMISDLTEILNGKQLLILAGDFNASRQFDENYTGNHHQVFFDRLSAFGLNSVYKLAGHSDNDYQQTYRHFKSNKPWQIDYIFLSKALSKNFLSYEIIEDKTVQSLSDHNIVVSEIKLE